MTRRPSPPRIIGRRQAPLPGRPSALRHSRTVGLVDLKVGKTDRDALREH